MTAAASDADLFGNGPPRSVLRRVGPIKPAVPSIGRRALLVVLIGWAPLVLLTVVQSLVLRRDEMSSLLWDAGVHARYLLAAPLLILAEAQCGSWLNSAVRRFTDSGMVPDSSRQRFDAAVVSTRELFRSPWVDIAVVVLAYVVLAAAVFSHPMQQIPAWHKTGGDAPVFSLAGWWHVLVSVPLLLLLLLGWLWRVALWARLLWLISRLDLRLVASHPDRAAGLSFVGHSVRAFSTVALAISAIAAGRSLQFVLLGGALPTPHLYFNAGLAAFVLAIFAAPLLVFTPTLVRVWRHGGLEYGMLANRLGGAFERKWLGRDVAVDQGALEQQDFSATTDLYSVVSNVQAIRFVPMDVKDLMPLGVSMLIPFVPVVLLTVPADLIWKSVKGLLF